MYYILNTPPWIAEKLLFTSSKTIFQGLENSLKICSFPATLGTIVLDMLQVKLDVS